MAESEKMPPAGGNQTEGDGALNNSIIPGCEPTVKQTPASVPEANAGTSIPPTGIAADAIPVGKPAEKGTAKVGGFLDAVRRRMEKDSDLDELAKLFDETEAAEELTPIPADVYDCRIVSGEMGRSKSGTPSYKVTFAVCSGEYQGRKIWHDLWLSPGAMPYAKRDLAKLGITAVEHMNASPKPGIICRVRVVTETSDNGNTYNKVKSFEVIRHESADDSAFAPGSDLPGGAQ